MCDGVGLEDRVSLRDSVCGVHLCDEKIDFIGCVNGCDNGVGLHTRYRPCKCEW